MLFKPPPLQKGDDTVKYLKKLAYSKKAAPYIFLTPFILSFLIFNLYPIISSFLMSFQKLKGFNTFSWVGLRNYENLWNKDFLTAVKTTTLVTAVECMVLTVFPLILAVVLNTNLFKRKNFFRAVFFIPTLASTIVAGIVFRMLFSDSDNAFMNSLLQVFGIKSQNFMLNYRWSIILMVVLSTWKSAGLYMIYFLSGLQTIPRDVYESAEIDGAGEFTKLLYITIPLLKPIIIYVFTILIFEGYRTFGESYVFWKESMPGNLGLTIVRYLYQQGFTYGDLGFGSAIGFVLLGIVLAINLLQLKGFGLFQDED